MKLNLRNLDPIREATIDLDKDLIVFCGRNNTGKTWVNYAIYGLSSPVYSGSFHTKQTND